MCSPLLSCKGGHFGWPLFCPSIFFSHWLVAPLFELLSVTSVPHHPLLTAGKISSHSEPQAPPQSASCKGASRAFKRECHGCQRRVLGHGNLLTFLTGKCCKFQGLALRDSLWDALRDPFAPFFKGCLLGNPYGMPSSKVGAWKKRRFV